MTSSFLSIALVSVLGFTFGFVGSIPVAGPISILILKLAMQNRVRNGIWLAAGAAIAEAGYAMFAFLGFSSFLARHAWVEPVSRIAGAAILIGLGLTFLLKKSERNSPPSGTRVEGGGNKRSFFLGLSITAMNPTLMVTWTAAITTLFSMHIISFAPHESFPFAIGVGLGIVSWFTLFLVLGSKHRRRLPERLLRRVSLVTAVLLLLLGAGLAVRAVQFFTAS